MKGLYKIILFAAVFALFSSNIVYSVPVFADDEDEDEKGDFEAPHISNEIIISFKPGVTLEAIEDFYEDFFDDYEISEEEEFDDDEEDNDPEERLASISVPATREILQILRSDPRVDYTEYNYIVTIDAIPNDSNFNQLWGLHNIGQNGGTADADIDAPETWDITTGSQNVIIGVIDTGIDYAHQDLVSNVWINPNEIPGNGVDDDGNGYVDDIHGINAITGSGDPFDDHGHGTHVSGTIGAEGNNSIGVAGVNWNVSIAACKFLDAGGSGTTANARECFDYFSNLRSAGNNVLITSNSWGGGGFSQSLKDAMAGSTLHVAAAGNSNSDNDSNPHYPSSYNLDNIIAVAASDRNDVIASFSSYGATSVDIAAPGVSIMSTWNNGGYNTISGTSMATPHVAGAAGLIWSSNPNLSSSQVKQRILSFGDSIINVGNNANKPTLTNDRLNVFNSLTVENDVTPPSAVTDLAVSGSGFSSVTLTWTATGDDGLTGTASSYDVRYSTLPISEANWNTATQATGEPAPKPSGSSETFTVSELSLSTTYYFALKVKDNLQNESGLSNVVTGNTLATGTTVFEDNMESGTALWTTAGNPGLWHLSTHQSNSAITSWYYGIEGAWNYNTGTSSNSGTLTSPSISLVSSTDAILTFYEWSEVESFTNFDRTRVQISTDGISWITIFESHGTENAFGQTVWMKQTVDLTPYIDENINIRFWFDTVDPIANTFEGWYVDDVKVVITPSGTPPPSPPPLPNTPPVAVDDAYFTDEDTTLNILAPGVLGNDTDTENDTLTAVLEAGPLNGALTLNSVGSFTYTPNADFNGVDTFTYRANDGTSNSNTAIVSITINPVNDPPTADAGLNQNVNEGVLVTLDGTLSSDSDGTITTYTWTQTAGTVVTLDTTIPAQPTFTAPSVGAAGETLTFSLVVTDDAGASSAADTVNINVADVNAPSPPPIESAILTVVDGFDEKNSATLKGEGKTYVIQASDNDWWETEFGFYTSYELSNENIPADSTIVSAVIYVEHFEEEGFTNGALEWAIGSGWPSSPIVWGSTNPQIRQGEGNEFTDSWDVTSFVDTPEKVNSMELLIKNNDNVEELKTLVDHIYAEATWSTGPPPNQLPIANAGLDQTLSDSDGTGAESVTLDGLLSYDLDGSIVSYEWKEGAFVLGTTANINPNLAVGAHTIELTVTDNEGAAASDTVVVTVNPNQVPIANAGIDQTVIDSNDDGVETVTLDGSASSDPDGTITNYEWKDGVTILGTTAKINPSFTVDTHTVTLTVKDNGGKTDTDTVIITVNPYVNQNPIANAGTDKSANDSDGTGAESINLDGSLSYDPDGSIFSYEWKEGTTVLGSTTIITPSFSVGTHTVTLTVTDDKGATNSNTVIITVNANQSPTANAGFDQTVTDNDNNGFETLTLIGSGSDPDGTIVGYEWKEGVTVLGTSATLTRSFSVGAHTITLTVTDNGDATGTDTIVVTVNANQSPTANAGPDQTVSDADGNGSEKVTLSGSGSDPDGTITSYKWEEGATLLGITQSISPSLNVGIHTITFTVTDNGGATASDTVIVTVNAVPTGPVGEGAKFSRNPDFSTEDRDFVIGETLYVKFYSDQLEYNDLNQAEWQFGQAQGNFDNYNDGFYTIQVVLTETVTEVPPGETDEIEFQGVIQDNKGRQLERQVIFMVTNNSAPSGSD